MSDHIDGPRSIGDPSIDLTDLFAFTSPMNPAKTVLALCVFPSAGADAMFSNVVHHAFVVRPASVAGRGDAAKFATHDPEIRFSCQFDPLEHQPGGAKPIQRGSCSLPGGQTLRFVVNDEKGVTSADNVFRVFAGLRSDPFFLAWLFRPLRKFPNLLLHDNVLCIVIEFDTARVLDSGRGSLFGVIAETQPIPQKGGFVGHDPPRLDWVGRPEQTNVRLNNPGLGTNDDIRDLWNQQTPFAIDEGVRPLFRKRLVESLANYDMHDGKADWTPAAISASAEVFLDDFLLFDVTKPITDSSHLEIEKSTLNGTPYLTGGGRTINANVIDILLTWLVNRDKGETMRGGATGATKPGTTEFPYLASPNTERQTVIESVDLAASADEVWNLVGQFGQLSWHPLVAAVELTGTGVGQLRGIELIDGKQIVERLKSSDAAQRSYSYQNIVGIPAENYEGTFGVRSTGTGCSVEWRGTYSLGGQPAIIVKTIVSVLFKTGFEALKKRFG